MRGLSNEFLKDLKEGCLKEVLAYVKRDDTLSLCIRDEYINIYYRGGSLYKISKKKSEKGKYIYEFSFNEKYFNHKDSYLLSNRVIVPKSENYIDYLSIIYELKREMDIYFGEHPKLEREFQQVLLRENNCSSISNDTDYYIADIEYASSDNIEGESLESRFDLIGVKWLSDSKNKKKRKNLKLSIMEMKYGDQSLNRDCGINDHIRKLAEFIKKKDLKEFYKEIETVFNQLIELELVDIESDKKIELDRDSKLEYIIIVANHKPASTILDRELSKIATEYPNLLNKIDIKVVTSSNMGYGLYDKCMKDIKEYDNSEY